MEFHDMKNIQLPTKPTQKYLVVRSPEKPFQSLNSMKVHRSWINKFFIQLRFVSFPVIILVTSIVLNVWRLRTWKGIKCSDSIPSSKSSHKKKALSKYKRVSPNTTSSTISTFLSWGIIGKNFITDKLT